MSDPKDGVASVVLAAGSSSRMGRPKLLLPFGSGTLLSAAVAPHLEAGLGRVIVVLGDRAEELRAAAGAADPRVSFVVNESWAEGMASSVRCGVEAGADAAALIIALGDQVGVDAARLKLLLDAWTPEVPLVVPVHGDRASHPVLFARALYDELRALRGDVGARDVVRRHWRQAARVAAPPLADIDTREEYEAVLQGRPVPPGDGLPLP